MGEGLFRRNADGRPEGTSKIGNNVIHYTCNAPDDETLEKNGIKKVGGRHGVEPNEVLLIPKKLFDNEGRPVDTAQAENLLAKMGKKK